MYRVVALLFAPLASACVAAPGLQVVATRSAPPAEISVISDTGARAAGVEVAALGVTWSMGHLIVDANLTAPPGPELGADILWWNAQGMPLGREDMFPQHATFTEHRLVALTWSAPTPQAVRAEIIITCSNCSK